MYENKERRNCHDDYITSTISKGWINYRENQVLEKGMDHVVIFLM